PLAGPVAAAAAVFAPGSRIPGVDDSKKLDAAARDRLAEEIKALALAWAVGFAAVEEIDTINIYWAGLLAMRRAVEGLSLAPEHLLLDARRLKDLSTPQQAIVKGDAKSLTIAAASILAKTARDALMCQLDAAHPASPFVRPWQPSRSSEPRRCIAVRLRRSGPCWACHLCLHGGRQRSPRHARRPDRCRRSLLLLASGTSKRRQRLVMVAVRLGRAA